MTGKRWGASLRQVVSLFCGYGVLEYIEDCFDYFHLEGDDAVFDDVVRYLERREVDVDAAFA